MTTPEREVVQVVRAARQGTAVNVRKSLVTAIFILHTLTLRRTWNGALLTVGSGVFGWFVLGDRAGHQPGASSGVVLTLFPGSGEAKAPSEQDHPRGRA
jgi:hypothetical protein